MSMLSPDWKLEECSTSSQCHICKRSTVGAKFDVIFNLKFAVSVKPFLKTFLFLSMREPFQLRWSSTT